MQTGNPKNVLHYHKKQQKVSNAAEGAELGGFEQNGFSLEVKINRCSYCCDSRLSNQAILHTSRHVLLWEKRFSVLMLKRRFVKKYL